MTKVAPDTAQDLIGVTLCDQYKLVRLLGAGGMGAVFQAQDPPEKPCAVKILRPEVAGQDSATRLLREANLTATIQSPHIIPILATGHDTTQNLLFLVMPLLQGRDVATCLEQLGPLDPAVAVRIALQAAKGLALTHQAGIVHRDIKPNNLFLHQRDDGQIVVVVCDFGLSKKFEFYDDTRLTWTGRFLGSPVYMSPEQAKSSKHVTELTDVWSLGVTLYELLCGKPPCDPQTTLAELLTAVCARDVPPLQDRAPWVDPALAVAVHRALRRNVEDRWASMQAFAQSLQAFCGDSDTLALDDLRPLDEATRKHKAPRADLALIASKSTEDEEGAGQGGEDPFVGQDLGAGYQILRLLGKGGMGAVYEAEGPTGERVAVKVIAKAAAGTSKEALRRFVREAKAATLIDDPHVVKVLETECDSALDVPFIAMELLDGVDCATLFKRHAPLQPQPLVRLILQAAQGLAAAHAKGIIHRDIKPANLFVHVDRATKSVTVKVCDFGIAKRTPLSEHHEDSLSDLTQTGKLMGSPVYMSPEQAKNAKDVDFRTDIWGLSLSLYEGLTGRRAWHGHTSLGELILAICTERLTPVRQLSPWVDPGLADIIDRGLARDPKDRFASIQEMVEALLPYSGGSIDLTRDQLQSVSEQLRKSVPELPPAASDQANLSTMGASSHAVNQAGPSGRSKKGGIALIASVVVVAAVAIAIAFRLGSGESPPAAAPEVTVTAHQSGAAAANLTARLEIAPPDATVTVQGIATPVTDGGIVLSGKPGDVFDVTVSAHGVTQTQRVVLTSSGELQPKRLEIQPVAQTPTADAAASTTSPRPLASRLPQSVKGQPIKPHGTASPTVTPGGLRPELTNPYQKP